MDSIIYIITRRIVIHVLMLTRSLPLSIQFELVDTHTHRVKYRLHAPPNKQQLELHIFIQLTYKCTHNDTNDSLFITYTFITLTMPLGNHIHAHTEICRILHDTEKNCTIFLTIPATDH